MASYSQKIKNIVVSSDKKKDLIIPIKPINPQPKIKTTIDGVLPILEISKDNKLEYVGDKLIDLPIHVFKDLEEEE